MASSVDQHDRHIKQGSHAQSLLGNCVYFGDGVFSDDIRCM